MSTPDRDLRVLVLGASLSSQSLNNRLAAFAARLVTEKGGTSELANVGDFDCPFYDHDIEVETGPPVGAHRFSERVKANAMLAVNPWEKRRVPLICSARTFASPSGWSAKTRPAPVAYCEKGRSKRLRGTVVAVKKPLVAIQL